MLSDFDLAKQSNELNAMPAMVHSETNGVSICMLCYASDSADCTAPTRRFL